jgi:hypothetical protein
VEFYKVVLHPWKTNPAVNARREIAIIMPLARIEIGFPQLTNSGLL